jgi:hypothetical protein
MDKLVVNLDGTPTEIRRQKIPLKQIILDIENPRIQYFLDTRYGVESLPLGNWTNLKERYNQQR